MIGDIFVIIAFSVIIGLTLAFIDLYRDNKHLNSEGKNSSFRRAIRRAKFLRKTCPDAFRIHTYYKFSSNKKMNLRLIRRRKRI